MAGTENTNTVLDSGTYEIIRKRLEEQRLNLLERLGNLNSARKELKHRGNLPAHATLAELVDGALRFFESAVRDVCAVDPGTISLVDFVELSAVRDRLRATEQAIAGGDIEGGLKSVALAFHDLMQDADTRTRGPLDEPLMGFPMNLPPSATYDAPSIVMAETLKTLERHSRDLHASVTLLGWGIDIRRYNIFKRKTPTVFRTLDGSIELVCSSNGNARPSDLVFCFDFVLDTALRVQEFKVSS